MFQLKNMQEAFILARAYNILPPHRVSGSIPAEVRYREDLHPRTTNRGKFEPDKTPDAEIRCMVLAHFSDRSNLLIKYRPADLSP